MIYLNNLSLRGHAALLCGLAGGATAQAMCLWGGDLARFMPPAFVLMGAASFGAACAGVVLADTMGRRGWRGALCFILAWPVVTGLGAAVASIPFGVSDAGLRGNVVNTLAAAVDAAAPLGLLAVGDGIVHSPHVAAVWVLSALAVHKVLQTERQLSI